MKKNEKRKLWKQGLGTALVCGLAVAVFPAAKADAADLLKAGPINTTAEHVTQNQPFAERTAGSQYFRIPAFIVTQKGNLLAAADARYSTTTRIFQILVKCSGQGYGIIPFQKDFPFF